MGLFFYRLLGAAMLDAGMYEGIEADRRTTGQALAAVVLSSLAAGIGASDWFGARLTTFALVSGIAVLTWSAWAMLVHQIGTRLLPGPETDADWGQLLRTTGFAAAPGLLQVFGVVTQARGVVFGATTLWMFTAMVVGVKHALDYRSTGRAVAVCGIGAALAAGLALALGMLLTTAVS